MDAEGEKKDDQAPTTLQKFLEIKFFALFSAQENRRNAHGRSCKPFLLWLNCQGGDILPT
jgi:hypothetical protein